MYCIVIESIVVCRVWKVSSGNTSSTVTLYSGLSMQYDCLLIVFVSDCLALCFLCTVSVWYGFIL